MTNHNPSAGNAPAHPSLADCQHEAVILAGCVEAISLMDNEGENFHNARTAVTRVALELTQKLTRDIGALETEGRHDA